MEIIDLTSNKFSWIPLKPAGADQKTRIVSLWADSDRGYRTVLMEFPPRWTRDAVGHQPTQEELLVVSGFVEVSGLTAREGQLLVGIPYATRSATFTPELTRVLAWFTGEAGGWQDGPADPPREMALLDLQVGAVLPPSADLRGSIQVFDELSGQSFGVDADLFWPDENEWTHLPAGSRAPVRLGRVVVKLWE